MSDYFWPTTASVGPIIVGFFVVVGGFAWFDGWKETTITNPDNFKILFL